MEPSLGIEDTKKIVFTVGFKVELKNEKLPKIEKLPEKLGKIFVQENEFTDVKIICDGRTFECHKLVLSCQSEVFKGTYPSSIYSWSIGHILEHEFFCLGHLGCAGSKEKKLI